MLPTLEIDYVVKEFMVQKDEAQIEAVMESLIRALEQKHPDNHLLSGYLKNMLDIFIKSSPDKLRLSSYTASVRFILSIGKSCRCFWRF